jgi:RNA polymerase sigma-70 factor (ECF subfamily)
MLSSFYKNTHKTDEDLLQLYQHSENLDVLGELYARYMDLVFGVCLKYLKNKEDAQDAVIQIFEKIIPALYKQKIDQFRPWLYVVAKNHCLMKLRSKKHHTTHIDDAVIPEAIIMESAIDLHPIDENEDENMEAALKKCIERLKFLQKESIELFYFKKLTYQQISEKMDIDVKKVKSYIQNAKRNLKICLQNNHG